MFVYSPASVALPASVAPWRSRYRASRELGDGQGVAQAQAGAAGPLAFRGVGPRLQTPARPPRVEPAGLRPRLDPPGRGPLADRGLRRCGLGSGAAGAWLLALGPRGL